MTTKETELLCFHGSPGIPEDFQFLRSEFPSLTCTAPPRAGYPGYSRLSLLKHNRRIVVGYSWGARVALEWAAKNPTEVDGMIFISPFLKTTSAGVLKKVLVSLPGVGTWLLRKSGPPAIDAFLKASTEPVAVSPEYLALAPKLTRPQVLRAALIEKASTPMDSGLLHRALASKPALTIWGAEDKNAVENDSLALLRRVFTQHLERKLSHAGHALVYTHCPQVADEIRTFLTLTQRNER